jgi:hypothetical protein
MTAVARDATRRYDAMAGWAAFGPLSHWRLFCRGSCGGFTGDPTDLIGPGYGALRMNASAGIGRLATNGANRPDWFEDFGFGDADGLCPQKGRLSEPDPQGASFVPTELARRWHRGAPQWNSGRGPTVVGAENAWKVPSIVAWEEGRHNASRINPLDFPRRCGSAVLAEYDRCTYHGPLLECRRVVWVSWSAP